MQNSRIYLGAKNEPELAGYQRLQSGNNCTLHAIAAAIKLLCNEDIDGESLSVEIDRLWWHGKIMRIFPKWAVTPRQQVRIVKHLAAKLALPIQASFVHATPAALLTSLADPAAVNLISLLWLPRRAPAIYHGEQAKNYNAGKSAGAHTLLLAAYDATHKNADHTLTPWGFINSWSNAGEHLYWMKDDEFTRAWHFFLPSVGPNPLVIIRRTA